MIDKTRRDTGNPLHGLKSVKQTLNAELNRPCKVDNSVNSALKKIQNERKSRIRDVCDMCRRNRTSMECNHVTMDEDSPRKVVYKNLIVDDKHKVLFKIVC